MDTRGWLTLGPVSDLLLKLEIVRYFRVKWTCTNAASGGQLVLIQWLHENGCPWDNEDICDEAAIGGHLELLQWIHEKGWPWKAFTCTAEATGGHHEVVQWLHNNGCP